MVRAQASTDIGRPVDDVFRFVAVDFFRNYPRWSPEVVELRPITPGPVRVGTAARQIRVDQGRRTESTFRVTELSDPHRVVFQGTSTPFLIAFQFEPRETRTRVTFTFELQRLALPWRPFERLIRFAVQDGAERLVRNLKTLIEAEAYGGGPSGSPPAL